MRKVSTSAQPHSYYHQRQQADPLKEGEKLSAEQIREFLHESRQNSESSNFDETIKNQQKMEKIMLKQTFLETNQLFDPIEYFGGLKVNDLNLKVDDSRLSDMFKMKGEEQGNQKDDIVSYHVKNVQQQLLHKKYGSVINSGEIDTDTKMKTNYFNSNQTTSLLGYSLSLQKADNRTIKSFNKSMQSSSRQLQNKQLNQQQIISSPDKENFIGMTGQLSSQKKLNILQQSNSAFGSPSNIKKSQMSQLNSLNQSQAQENQNNKQSNENQLPLQASNLNKQNQQLIVQQQQIQNSLQESTYNKQPNEFMISPEQVQKQKSTGGQSIQLGTGNPLFFSFQQNGGIQNGLVGQCENKQNNQEVPKAINKNSKAQSQYNNYSSSNSVTPIKQNLSTKDVKAACIPNDTSPSSHQVITSKPLIKKEGVLNRMQLLQAVEQINIESQRKVVDLSNSNLNSKASTATTPSSKVLQNAKQDGNKLNSISLKQNQQPQQYQQSSTNTCLIQQNNSYEITPMNSMKSFQQSQTTSGANTPNVNNYQNQQYPQTFGNHPNTIAIVEDYQPNQQKLENIEFYDQSNWQSVQQTSQHMQSVENGFGLSVSNHYNQSVTTQSAAFQDHFQSQDKSNNLQDSIISQQINGVGMGLTKSGLHHHSQSKMFEQKLTSEQFFKDKENLELTFQEDTANNDEESEEEFNYQQSQNQSQDQNFLMFQKQYKSEAHQSPQNKTNSIPTSQRYHTNKLLANNSNAMSSIQGQGSISEISSVEQQNQSSISVNAPIKRMKEKSKSMLQGDLLNAINQKPNPNTNIPIQYSSRNNSKELNQKKNNYFVQRQVNSGSTSNKSKPFTTMSIPQKTLISGTTQSRINREKDNSLIGRQNYSSYNNSKMSSSIMQNEKSHISCDKSQIINTSVLNTNINLSKSNINEKHYQNNNSNFNQSLQNSVLANLNGKLISHQKKNSVQMTCNKETFLSPKTSSKNTPRSVSQYNSIDYNNSNTNFYNAAASSVHQNQSLPQQQSKNYTNNKSQPNLYIQPHLNQTLASSILNKIGNVSSQTTINNNSSQTLNIANSNSNFTNNGGMINNNSSTYLKRPQGKSIHYDYRSIANQSNNNSKPRLISSPTHSPSNYKVKQTPQNNQQQTIRQKKLMHRLDCVNSSKNTSQVPSFRDQIHNNSNIQGNGINIGSNSTKISSYVNTNNLLSSITVSSGKYGGEQIDKDLKYNIALEAKKQSLKIDSKYEDTLNHLMSMQSRVHNTSISQNNNNNNQNFQQQGLSINQSTTNILQVQNPIKSSNTNLNYQKGTQLQSQHNAIYS